jgi:glycosyltransferase involved in cell wall biosynthesis
MKIIHLITSLSNGGAESVLYRLCTSDNSLHHHVVSMMGPGKYGPLLEQAGVRVTCLNMRAGSVSISGIWRLYRLLRKERPYVVQTWMYHADLVGGVVARLAGVRKVFWNIRHSELETGKSKRSTIWVAKTCAFLSNWVPLKIICCAEKARQVHTAYGYDATKMVVIANGYNLAQFKPDTDARQVIRYGLGVKDDELLLGMVGRFNVQKNHAGLLQVLNLLKVQGVAFKCALVGKNMNSANHKLGVWIAELGLNDEVLLLDQRSDIPAIMNALDIHVFSSTFGEGFPNVLAEAMACGTPCVTTDVGDAAYIVGNTGWVVPPGDLNALANAIEKSLNEIKHDQWALRCTSARERIQKNFSIKKMVTSYHELWSKLL